MEKRRIVGLAGQAGSGKDTVGNHLAAVFGGCTLGQADPLKRFASCVFGFSEEQLWGPSEMRNARDARFEYPTTELLDSLENAFDYQAKAWIKDVLPGLGWFAARKAYKSLEQWFAGILKRIGRGEGLTPRVVLQLLGSEWGRNFSQDMWVDYAIRKAIALLEGPNQYNRKLGLRFSSRPQHLVVITDVRFANEIAKIQNAQGVVFKISRPGSILSTAAEAAGIKGHSSEQELNGIPDDQYDDIILNDATLIDLYTRAVLAAEEAVG